MVCIGRRSMPSRRSSRNQRVVLVLAHSRRTRFAVDLSSGRRRIEPSFAATEFVFYDGPPFATGLPHYGHILAGSIKDIVTRSAHYTRSTTASSARSKFLGPAEVSSELRLFRTTLRTWRNCERSKEQRTVRAPTARLSFAAAAIAWFSHGFSSSTGGSA